jgi:hypothetical protein
MYFICTYISCIYTYEDSIRKPTKPCVEEGGRWKHKGGGKLVQGTLYVCKELSQRNTLIVMYDKLKKIKMKMKTKHLRLSTVAHTGSLQPWRGQQDPISNKQNKTKTKHLQGTHH